MFSDIHAVMNAPNIYINIIILLVAGNTGYVININNLTACYRGAEKIKLQQGCKGMLTKNTAAVLHRLRSYSG